MCGIVGLLVKTPALRERLGVLMVPMLIGMTERGPDSAGLAVFGKPVDASQRKLSLYAGFTKEGSDFAWQPLVEALNAAMDVTARVDSKGNHAVLTVQGDVEGVKTWLREHYPKLYLLSSGRSIDLYKDIGSPSQVAGRYDFANLRGTAPIHSQPATTSVWFTTVRCRTRMVCAASSNRKAFTSIPTTTPKPPAAFSNGGCAKATRCRSHCRRASKNSMASTRS
jgi:glutamate synthase domain-containing protein 1